MKNAADVLAAMATTYRERNAIYGDNFKMVAPLMAALFPNGVPSALVVRHQFHLFELILVKLSRFAISELTHADSIHDAAVYCAMIEALLPEPQPAPVVSVQGAESVSVGGKRYVKTGLHHWVLDEGETNA